MERSTSLVEAAVNSHKNNLNILKFMERASLKKRRHVPSVPNLNPSELEALRQIFKGSEHETLQIIFSQGSLIGFDQAQKLFHPLDLNRLIHSGLLYEDEHGIRSHFQAQSYDGLIFFSDFFQWESDKDFVLSIGPAGNYLALLTIRRRVASTLDLGCGCGIQSLLAARHSDKVVAIDINLRALALTRFNAELNNIHNIETTQGSYFEPVKGQRFDLIVANLPYVITPEKHLIYRTVDQSGNTALYERLKEIPTYLNEGSFAQILINWIHNKNQDPLEPIHKATENLGMDTYLIHNGSKQPDDYADMWLKHLSQNDQRKFQKTKQDWLRWYRHQNIEKIALGAITLRRQSNKRNWFYSETINKALENPAGEQLLHLFTSQDNLNVQR